jgi:hypothetical protein
VKDPYTLVVDLNVVQIWHRDANGHDGACGWSYPNPTEKQREALKNLGFWEGRERHFLRYPYKSYSADVADRETLYRAAILIVARVMRINLSFDEAARMAAEKFGVGGVEGPDGLFCWLPGYHCNGPDSPEERADHWARCCWSIARELLRRRRSWWQHPRWHIHHWRLHFPLLHRWFGWSGVA